MVPVVTFTNAFETKLRWPLEMYRTHPQEAVNPRFETAVYALLINCWNWSSL